MKKFDGHLIYVIEVILSYELYDMSHLWISEELIVNFFSDVDHQLDVIELEDIIQALYELSDPDMARIETYNEAIERVKQSFLSNPDDDDETAELLHSVTKGEFMNIVQNDATIMKLIDCRSPANRRASKFENSTAISLKKLKFKRSIHKSLSDSGLTAPHENA